MQWCRQIHHGPYCKKGYTAPLYLVLDKLAKSDPVIVPYKV